MGPRIITIIIILSILSTSCSGALLNTEASVPRRSLLMRSAKQKAKQRRIVVLSNEKWKKDKKRKEKTENDACIRGWFEDKRNQKIATCLLGAFQGLARIFSEQRSVRNDYQKALSVLGQFRNVEVDEGIVELVDGEWNDVVEDLKEDAMGFINITETRLNISLPDAVRNFCWSLLLLESMDCIESKQRVGINVDKEIKHWDLCLFLLFIVIGINYWYFKKHIAPGDDAQNESMY